MFYNCFRTLLVNIFYLASVFFGEVDIKRAGNNTRLVRVAVTSVSDVSHPSAFVPPKPLKQKMIKPAISTRLV